MKLEQKLKELEQKNIELKRELQLVTERLQEEVNKRRPADNKLRDVMTMLDSVIAQSPVPMTVVNLNGTIQVLNEAARKTLGFSYDEASPGTKLGEMKKSWETYDADGNIVSFEQAPVLRALKGETIRGKEYRIVRKDGDERWQVASAAPILDSQGNIIAGFATFPDITGWKKDKEELRESEEKYRRLVELSPDMILVYSQEGTIEFINETGMNILGGSAIKDIIGKSAFDFVSEEDHKSIRKRIQNSYKSNKSAPIEEKTFIRLDGTSVQVETSAMPFKYNGKPAFQVIARDITERKQAEEALLSEKLLAEEYINSLPGLFYVFDEERFVKWNKEWETVSGYSADEISQMYGTDFFEGSDKTLIADRMRKVFVDGIADAEAEIVTKQGKRIPHYFSGIRKEFHGKPHLVGLAIDITARKLAEKALKESQANLLQAQFIARMGDFAWNIATGSVTWSEGMHKLLKYDKDEKIDYKKVNSDVHHPDDLERVTKWLMAAIDSGKEYLTPNEYRLIDKEGEVHFVQTNGQIEFQDGKPVRVFGTCMDITELKRAEEAKEKLEDQLRQAHKMEAIGTLAGGIAHEFNNILGIIVGNTELAMGGVPEWNTAHYNLEEVKTASLRARDIVKQILSFSRQTEHELKPVNIASIIDESIKFIRSSIPTDIEIKKDISARLDTINADSTQIHQILLNLCTNAAYAMRDQGGILEIFLKNVELDENTEKNYEGLNPGIHVKLTVSDTGHGIEKEDIEHIFDPFFTTKEVGQGTGMGLSVVHGIVKEHNGSITVQSKPGKGTTFHVLFPVIEAPVAPEIETVTPLLKGSERILFVDDEESLVVAAKKNLEDMGYDVVSKRSPVKALELFKEQPDEFDLVITDMAMPAMPGDRLAVEIMKIRPDIPVIACTGYSDRMNGEQAKEMGISAYVMKPYLASELATAIRLVLDQEKGEKTQEKVRVLVVDDEEQMRSMLRQVLESAGYEVMEAPDGNVALWIFKEKPADLIITDIIMPEKEGLETIIELKQDFPDVKIIAISGGGHGNKGQYLDMAKKMGADNTLAKPFEKEELLKTVHNLLSLT